MVLAALAVAAAFCVPSCVSVTGGHDGKGSSPADSLSVSGRDAAEGWFREPLSRLGRVAEEEVDACLRCAAGVCFDVTPPATDTTRGRLVFAFSQ